jgi:hypothetical protein
MSIRTSVSHPIRIDELSILNGWLGMSFCAGKKTWDILVVMFGIVI